MKKLTSILFTAALLTSHLTSAANVLVGEQAIESSTTYLSLPQRLPSVITLAPCDNGCASAVLQLSERSKFFVGRQPVSYSQFKESAARAGLNLAVFFDANDKVVTRIVVFANNQ